ncbi:hypothetical protein [Accumulibacter sp.]|uniref:hypothetical protein n=1 Tax=Accumulibacter sp. TaxID=2053492 RepID=UPI001A4F61DA|nr:hypothetical protein [Accumulibacter sp.]MBL8374874.1 hypothetical protein [Accumulibacter sp.]
MQALLSFDQAPPIAAPLRFFLTAPLFAILAGMLLLWSGPELFASRWTPSALAMTHLITAGFMLPVMLGAMIQILPVVAGANMPRPLLMSSLVHAAIVPGALLLTAGILTSQPLALQLAVLLLGIGIALFLGAAGHALVSVRSTNPTIQGLKLALIGLSVTAGLGMLLAMARDGSFALPIRQLTSIHLGWGLVGWNLVLLAAVALVVVPMFQITPPFPAWFARGFSWAALSVLCLWSIAVGAGWPWPSAFLAGAVVLTVAVFAALTLRVQHRSRRARFDASQHFWRLAMLCLLAACALWFAADSLPALAERQEWPLLCGVLALLGGFMSVMIGMLYKIVPFLVWLHLQNLGDGRVMAPNMNKVIATRQVDRQLYAHVVSLALLLAAVIWPEWFTYPAGLALVLANGWLLYNLLTAVAFYRYQCLQIAAQSSATPAAQGPC